MSTKKKQQQAKVVTPQDVTGASASMAPKPDFFDSLGKKTIWVAVGLLSVMLFWVFKDYLTGQNAYFFKDIGSDSYNYSYPYLYHVADYMAQHGLPQWSFEYGMGQNLFPFFLRDPFIILLLLSGKSHILFGIVFNEVAKMLTGGIFFYLYLRRVGLAYFTSVVGSLMFAFCGFTIVGSGWYIFSFEAVNMAMLLLGFELLYQRRSMYLFAISILLLAMSQPFNLYVYGLFIAAYAVLRMVQDEAFSWKALGLLMVRMAGAGIVGVLLAGPFLLENTVQLLESPRGSGNTSYTSILSSMPMFKVADPTLLGTSILRFFSSDLLGTGNAFKGWQNTLEAPLFYCGIPCLLLMPQVFPYLKKKVRLFFIVFMALWLLPIVFPWFRYAFWLFTGDYFRAYAFIVAVFMLYYSVTALDHILRHRKINLVVLIASVLLLFLLLNYPYFEATDAVNSPVFTFVSFLMLVYAGLLFAVGRPSAPDYLRYILLGAVVLELTYMSGTSVNDREPVTAAEVPERVGYNDYTLDALAYINKTDKSFYRVDKSYASSPAMHYSLNDAMAQDYRGTSEYSPFNQLYYIRYLQTVEASDKTNEHESRWARGIPGRIMLESLNRVKYMMAKTDVLPLWRLTCDSLGTFGDVKLFRNKFTLPFGYVYHSYIKMSDFEKLPMTQKDFVSLRAVAVADEDAAKLQGMTQFRLADTIAQAAFNTDYYRQFVDALAHDSLQAPVVKETEIKGSVQGATAGLVYLTVPFDGGWKLMVDGKEQEKSQVFGGMTAAFVPAGTHTVEMVYHLRYFNTGLILSLVGLGGMAVLWFLSRRKSGGDALAQAA